MQKQMIVVRASDAGARLNTNLLSGGGTDDTAVLQRILNRALDGSPVHLILDGPALISGLDIAGNTTIEGTTGAGFYLADGSDRTVLRNAHRTRGDVIDKDIALRSLFINGNRSGQTAIGRLMGRYDLQQIDREGSFKSGVEFLGIERLTLTDLRIFNQRSFGIWIATANHVVMRDIEVDANIPIYPGLSSPADQRHFLDEIRSNLDGLHINGPSSDIVVDGARFRCEDDSISITANDASRDMIPSNDMGPYIGQGPVTDVVVRNVMLMDSIQGIRLLSSDQRIDRILIENVGGTVRHQMAQITNFHHDADGAVGTVTFRNINIDPLPSATWAEIYPDWIAANPEGEGDGQVDIPLFSIRAKIDRLVLDGISAALVDSRPLIRIGNNAQVGTLEASFVVSGHTEEVNPLKIVSPAEVRRLQLSVSNHVSK